MDYTYQTIQIINDFLPKLQSLVESLRSPVPLDRAIRELLAEGLCGLVEALQVVSAGFQEIQRVVQDCNLEAELRDIGLHWREGASEQEPLSANDRAISGDYGNEQPMVTLHIICPHCLQHQADAESPREELDRPILFECLPGCGEHSIIMPPIGMPDLPHLQEVYVTGEPITPEEAAEYEAGMTE
jgi:hypothetical protein